MEALTLAGGEEVARDMFIFSCYTGLAYSDLVKITKSDIIEENGKLIIEDKRQKTGSGYHIVLLPQAENILKKYDFNLNLLSNQKCNQYLKLIAQRCGIRINLTMHVGRHTFATWALQKGVRIEVVSKTSINLNENLDSLVPASKISDMPTGWICGQTARDFVKTKTGRGDSMKIQETEEFQTTKFYCKTDFDMAEISKEEAEYVDLPKFYTFPSKEERERVLYSNFLRVGMEVKEMIAEIQRKGAAK